MNYDVGSWTYLHFVIMIVKPQRNMFSDCNGDKKSSMFYEEKVIT
jgi:hypothetical protein